MFIRSFWKHEQEVRNETSKIVSKRARIEVMFQFFNEKSTKLIPSGPTENEKSF